LACFLVSNAPARYDTAHLESHFDFLHLVRHIASDIVMLFVHLTDKGIKVTFTPVPVTALVRETQIDEI
jgi:hypothetical protein